MGIFELTTGGAIGMLGAGLAVCLASKYFPQTLLPMGLANAAGLLFSILVCVIAYTILTRREKRAQEAT